MQELDIAEEIRKVKRQIYKEIPQIEITWNPYLFEKFEDLMRYYNVPKSKIYRFMGVDNKKGKFTNKDYKVKIKKPNYAGNKI